MLLPAARSAVDAALRQQASDEDELLGAQVELRAKDVAWDTARALLDTRPRPYSMANLHDSDWQAIARRGGFDDALMARFVEVAQRALDARRGRRSDRGAQT